MELPRIRKLGLIFGLVYLKNREEGIEKRGLKNRMGLMKWSLIYRLQRNSRNKEWIQDVTLLLN